MMQSSGRRVFSRRRALGYGLGGLAAVAVAVTVDGGGGYWNPHPGDNPQAMLTDELIPMCASGPALAGQKRALGRVRSRSVKPRAMSVGVAEQRVGGLLGL
jgi:hypothetical protein